MKNAHSFQNSILEMFESLSAYADAHQKAYESPIGEDGVLGAHWLAMAEGLVGLLNGETGGIDCGAFDRAVRALALANGFSQQEADTLQPESES